MSFAERLTVTRKASGLSQYGLARRINRDQSAVALWERGKTRPRPDALRRIAEVLSVAENWLLFGDDEAASGRRIKVSGVADRKGIVRPVAFGALPEIPAMRPIFRDDMQVDQAVMMSESTHHHAAGDILFLGAVTGPETAFGGQAVADLADGARIVARIHPGGNGVTLVRSDGSVEWRTDVKSLRPVIWVKCRSHVQRGRRAEASRSP